MKRKLISGIFALAALLTVSSAFYSCKDYDEELKADYTNQITTLKSALESRLSTVEGDITSLQQKDAAQQTQIESLDADLETVEGQVETLTSSLGDLQVKVERNTGKITVLEQDMTTAKADILAAQESITGIKGDITDIKGDVSEVQGLVNTVQTNLNDLTARIDKIEKLIKEMVTSVEVRSMESPVVGSLILPVDVQSNILAAYYGVTTSKVQFPKIDKVLTTSNAQKLWGEGLYNTDTYKNLPALDIIASGDTIKNTDAGTVYLNINPSTVDFTGKAFQLVNSQNEKGGVTLGEAKESDKVLTFGYTRADGNKLYEIPATLTDINKCKFAFADNAQTVVSSLKNSKSTGDIEFKKLAVQLQEAMTNLGEVYDVQTSWTDANEETHYVSAGQNIGTYAVNPLSYKFLEGQTWSGNVTVKGHTFNLTEIPTIDAIVAKFNGVIDNAKTKIVEAANNNAKGACVRFYIDFKNVEGTDATALDNAFDALGSTDPSEVAEIYLADVKIGDETLPAYLTYELNADGSVAKWLAYVDYPVKALAEQIAGYGDAVADKVDAVADKVEPYYNKVQAFANKVLDYAKTPNDLLQPVVLYSADGSYNSLSADSLIPTKLQVVGDSLIIYPTSITSELFAPAYKKYIAVIDYAESPDGNGKPAKAETKECTMKGCMCHSNHGDFLLYETDDNGNLLKDENGNLKPIYKKDGVAYCHAIPADGTVRDIHKIGEQGCDISHCTCEMGKCPNVWCVNHTGWVSDGHDAVAETKSLHENAVKQQSVFDGDVRTYKISDVKEGRYTIIYQCLDYSGNIVTKKYYIEVSK